MAAAAVSVAVVGHPPIANETSATPTHRGCGRVLRQRLTVNPLFLCHCRNLSRGPPLSEPQPVEAVRGYFAGF